MTPPDSAKSADPGVGNVPAEPTTPGSREKLRRVWGWVVTTAAALLVLAVLVVPGQPSLPGPAMLLRIPVEGLVVAGLLLALRGRARTVAAAVAGTVLGLWAVVRLLDVGFHIFLARPFDPVLDWSFLGVAVDVLGRDMSEAQLRWTVAGAVLAAVVLVALVALAVVWLSRLGGRRRAAATRVVAVLTAVWVVGALVHSPMAGRDLADRLGVVWTSLRDPDIFARELEYDPYRSTPAEELLTALRGKDVLIVLVESYGRAAVEHPDIAERVGAVLDEGTRRLAAAGYQTRSAFLTSPTVGGGSWLASATLLSGAWIENQQRYEDLAASNRLTLTSAFHRAGWRTVAVMPGLTDDWPQGQFYGYDRVSGMHDLGYPGPLYGFDSIPDQYVLSHFQRTERGPGQAGPVMAVIPLLSSHAPWSPVPPLVDWESLEDSADFAYPVPDVPLEPAEVVLQRSVTRVRADYANAVSYSLETIVSYVERYGGEDLVVVFLGDHQPAPLVTGAVGGSDAPIAVVARDPAVLEHIADWGWVAGLRPGPEAPVWRMDAFRDRFLSAFS